MIYTAGVDFGNYYSVIAVPKYYGHKVLLNQSSNHLTPTIVTYSNERRYSGILSSDKQISYPQNTITNLKKVINLPYGSKEREELSNSIPYDNLIKLSDGTVGFKVFYKNKETILRPEQCIAYFFNDLKSLSNVDELNNYVIAVNPQWTERKLRSIISSCKIAHIQVSCLLKSPISAAIFYLIQNGQKVPKPNQKSVNVAFVDIGETGMTVSIVELKQQFIQLKSFNYTEKVNGSILTQLFEKYLIEKVKEKCQIDPTEKVEDRIIFSKAVEKVKRTLSIDNTCTFEFQSSTNVNSTFSVTRKEFNDLFADVRNIMEPQINDALSQAKIRKNELFEVQIIGGSSNVVSFQTELKRIFGKKPKQPANYDQCLAIGCAYMADYLSSKMKFPILLKDFLHRSIVARWGENDEVTIFKKFTEIPAAGTVKIAVTNSLEVSLFEDENERIAKLIIQTDLPEKVNVSVSFQLTLSCLTTVNSCFYVKDGQTVKVKYLALYDGEFEEEHLDEFTKFESEDKKIELEEKKFSEAKNEFNSQISMINELIENGFYEYVDPSIVGEVKGKIETIQNWYKEKENDNINSEEFNRQICELKNITSPVIERMNSCKNSIGELTALKNRAFELNEKYTQKVDPRILASLVKFAQKIENVIETMKYKDVNFNIEKNKAVLDQLANNLENLSKKKQ